MERTIAERYLDPVDEIWLTAARRLGLELRRASDAYASYDGRGVLTVAQPDQLDPDDCLAQIVLHELCHALIAGEGAFAAADWGLSNTDGRDLVAEHACHRLQAALADRCGLRGLMAVTTDHRPYWDALPDDPLAPGDDPAIELARNGFLRSRQAPFRGVLDAALESTAAIAHAMRPHAEADSLWARTLPPHPTGFGLHRNPLRHCADCAWLARLGPGKPVARCRKTRSGAGEVAQRVAPEGRACERWEPRLSDAACGACGACCREGFDIVHVRPREATARLHPSLVQAGPHGLQLPRPEGRCVALDGHGTQRAPYRCRIYAERPRACAEFPIAGDACLQARRRVGLSR